MTKLFQWRRGTTAQHVPFVGALGEITVDTDKDTLVVHNGATPGGFPLLSEASLSNMNITGGSITGMPDPTISTDVATKNYVDNEFTILSGINAVKNFAESGDDFVINNKHQLIVYDEYIVEAGGTLTIDINAALVVL